MVAPRMLADILIGELAATFPQQQLLGAWLYGSRARGEAWAGSDIDLAVLCDGPLDPVALFDAGCRLSARLGKSVELVDLRRAGGLLRVEVTHHGRPLTSLSTEADLFATHALSDHAAFAPGGGRRPEPSRKSSVADDVVVQKLASIDRCLASVRRYVAGELAIDAACREVSRRRLGVPADSGDAFPILEREGILSAAVAEPMRRMVGVRNVAVHEYRRLDPDIVRTVVERRRGDFGTLCREPLAA